MNWQQVCEDPNLQNLPYKIELDHCGRIIMSPVKIYHALYSSKIGNLLGNLLKGHTLVECAIQTRRGTKVADVAWCSDERLEQIKEAFDAPIAPEICVEVLSSGHTRREMKQKRALYFEQGAQEVWICDEEGQMSFFSQEGPLEQSSLVPRFPQQITIG